MSCAICGGDNCKPDFHRLEDHVATSGGKKRKKRSLKRRYNGRKSPAELGPCSYCGRFHHRRCWKKHKDKKAAKMLLKTDATQDI